MDIKQALLAFFLVGQETADRHSLPLDWPRTQCRSVAPAAKGGTGCPFQSRRAARQGLLVLCQE